MTNSQKWCNFHFQFKSKDIQSPYHEAVQTLTTTLLKAASSKHICHTFILSENISFSADFVYKWLVTNNISSEIMEKITIAVQDEEIQHIMDISVVQMFISRTTRQGRETNSSQYIPIEDSIDDDEI